MEIVPDGASCDLESLIHATVVPPQPGISWLGQAGFLIRWREFRLVIDPYLSDSLATKYRGTRFPHTAHGAAADCP